MISGAAHAVEDDGPCVQRIFFGGRRCIAQRVLHAQFRILGPGHVMVPEHVQRLDVPEGSEKRAEPVKPFVVQRETGHDHVADPHRCPPLCEVREEREDVRVRLAGELPVLLIVDVFDVQHDEVRDLHQPVEFREAMYVFRVERDARGVEARVDAPRLRCREQFGHKGDLRQWFPTGTGDAAALQQGRDTVVLLQDVLNRPLRAPAPLPGVRVVAVEEMIFSSVLSPSVLITSPSWE